MMEHEGFYYLPILPADMREKLDSLPSDKEKWPAEFKDEYQQRSKAFNRAKNEMHRLVRLDRNSAFSTRAKQVVDYLIDCVNFETGLCNPSHATIAEDIGCSERTVDRMTDRINAWVRAKRTSRTTSCLYQIRVSIDHVKGIEERDAFVREERKLKYERKKLQLQHPEPPKVSARRQYEPTLLRSHEPTELSDKHRNRTWEREPGNNGYGMEEETHTDRALSDDWYTPEELASMEIQAGETEAPWNPFDSDDEVAFSRPRDDADTKQLMDDIAAYYAEVGIPIGLRMRATMSSMHRAGLLSPASVRRMVEQTHKGAGNAAA
jgi:hypothetical protein